MTSDYLDKIELADAYEFIKDLEKERDGFAERNKDVLFISYFLSLFNNARYYLEEVIKLLEKEKRGKL